LLHDAGVTVVNRDVFERNAELIREHLGERGLVPLAVRRRAGCRADAAVALDRDLRMFPPTGREERGRADPAHFDVHRQAQADESSLRFGRISFRLQALPVRVPQREVQRLFVVARVVHRTHLGLEGELVRLDEVLAPQIGRVHVELPREHVHRALDEVARFRAARASIRVGRRLVREHFGDRHTDCRDVVGRVCHQHGEGGHQRGEEHVVGADVGDEAELQAEHLAGARGGDVHVAEDVTSMNRGHEGF
jgi:hypothetical protein